MNSHSWREDALCQQVDPELFFPISAGRYRAEPALAVCAACPVREPCLREAIEQGDDWSVRGGTTPSDRRKLMRALRRKGLTTLPEFEILP